MIITIITFISNGKIETIEINILNYVAIGDSFTVGEGLDQEKSWPFQLTQKLNGAGISIELTANPSKTGWIIPLAIKTELPVLKKINLILLLF